MSTYAKGDQVIGLGRGGRIWSPRPTGTVTAIIDANTIRVQWNDCAVEDDMAPADLLPQDQECVTCGVTIVCPQVPSPGNPMQWRDEDGWYGDVTHLHSPIVR